MSPRRSSCGTIWTGRADTTERETDMRRAFLFFLLLLMLGAGYLYLALYRPYQGFPDGGVYVDIPHGASQRTIARLLERKWRGAQPARF